MRHLYLIRHAKAANDRLARDIDRDLTKRGRRDATRTGTILSAFELPPSVIIASSAVRTRVTAEIIAKACRCRVSLEPTLYLGSDHTILNVIASTENQLDSIAIVGHNPSISYVANYLAEHTAISMKTASVAYFTFEGSWDQIETVAVSFQQFFTPRAQPSSDP